MNGLLILFLLFSTSFLLTKLACFLALKKQWLDVPVARSSHTIPKPKSGGLAFVVTFCAALGFIFYQKAIPQNEFFALMLGLLVAILGLIDDLIHLSIKIRIRLHFVLALFILFLLGGPPEISFFSMTVSFQSLIATVIGYCIAAWVFVWVINLYNFMDGIDGLAALEAIFVSLAAAFIVWTQAGMNTDVSLLLYLAAVVLGFLLMNAPPAKIFMGDVGSNFLGFILCVLGFITIKHGWLDVWSWGILLGVFVVDATVTLLARMRSGEMWYHAHRSHAYQQAAIQYSSHRKVDLGLTLINCFWLFPLAWFSVNTEGWGLALMLLAYLPLIILVNHYRKA